MKNKGFLLLTEQERNAKFKAALHTKTGGRLTGDEIQEILHILPADKQYEILVYHETDEFCLGVTRMKGAESGSYWERIFKDSKIRQGNWCVICSPKAVAIAVRKKSSLEECGQLHILIPPERCRKEQGCL